MNRRRQANYQKLLTGRVQKGGIIPESVKGIEFVPLRQDYTVPIETHRKLLEAVAKSIAMPHGLLDDTCQCPACQQ